MPCRDERGVSIFHWIGDRNRPRHNIQKQAAVFVQPGYIETRNLPNNRWTKSRKRHVAKRVAILIVFHKHHRRESAGVWNTATNV